MSPSTPPANDDFGSDMPLDFAYADRPLIRTHQQGASSGPSHVTVCSRKDPEFSSSHNLKHTAAQHKHLSSNENLHPGPLLIDNVLYYPYRPNGAVDFPVLDTTSNKFSSVQPPSSFGSTLSNSNGAGQTTHSHPHNAFDTAGQAQDHFVVPELSQYGWENEYKFDTAQTFALQNDFLPPSNVYESGNGLLDAKLFMNNVEASNLNFSENGFQLQVDTSSILQLPQMEAGSKIAGVEFPVWDQDQTQAPMDPSLSMTLYPVHQPIFGHGTSSDATTGTANLIDGNTSLIHPLSYQQPGPSMIGPYSITSTRLQDPPNTNPYFQPPQPRQQRITPPRAQRQPGAFTCTVCGLVLTRREGLRRHMQAKHTANPTLFVYSEPGCNKGYKRADKLTEHCGKTGH